MILPAPRHRAPVFTHGEIVEDHGVAVGRIRVARSPAQLVLEQLFVEPAHRGRGIATALIRDLVESAEARAVPLRATVDYASPARELLERCGLWIADLHGPRATMEWSREEPIPMIAAPPHLIELLRSALAAWVAGDDRADVWGPLDYLLPEAEGLTSDGIIAGDLRFRSPTSLTVLGTISSLGRDRCPNDPFGATIELDPVDQSLVALVLRWGDAARGLGGYGEQVRDPAQVAEWAYVFRWSCGSGGS